MRCCNVAFVRKEGEEGGEDEEETAFSEKGEDDASPLLPVLSVLTASNAILLTEVDDNEAFDVNGASTYFGCFSGNRSTSF